jgi:hypothetical protein
LGSRVGSSSVEKRRSQAWRTFSSVSWIIALGLERLV